MVDFASSLYSDTSQGQIDSFKALNRGNNSIYSEKDWVSERTHSIDMIKEDDEEGEGKEEGEANNNESNNEN